MEELPGVAISQDSIVSSPTDGPKKHQGITIVELHMLDKRKFIPLTIISGFTIRSILHPFTVIKTRLQVQKHTAVYKGTFDAFSKISKFEGMRGLYKGFWISNMLILPQMSYILTYEGVRHKLASLNHPVFSRNKFRSFIGGGCASLAGQTFIVPIDVVTQHLMMLGGNKQAKGPSVVAHMDHLKIPPEALNSRVGAAKAVITAVYRQEGLKGFYKGYFVSLATYAPNSALWWFFYDIYSGILSDMAPVWVPRLVLQVISAPMGGFTTALFTNPIDIVRARIQVENTKFMPTARNLWQEERLGIFTKGLSARLIQSITFSFFIILGYESIKRLALLDEYKPTVRW